MPTDRESDAVLIGHVGRPHGVDGAFVVEGASEDPARFEVGAELFVAGERARVVASRRVGRGRPAIKLDRPAERGAVLTVSRTELPALVEDAYYVSDLIGMEVVLDDARIGVVREVHPGPANDALELDTGLLLPLVDACVREIDTERRRILLNPGFTD